MNVVNLLMDRVQGMPDATAIIDYRGGKPRTLSFEELDRSAGQLAALLRQTGLQTGETVLILCPMSAELYLMLAAIFRLGLVALFLDPSTPREQLESSLKGRLPRALFGGRAVQAWRWFNTMLRRIPFSFCTAAGIPGTIPIRSAARLEPLSEIAACSNETPALITFTSGTGSQPKAALRTHGFLRAQLEALNACIRYTPGETDLATLPIFVLANLASGLTSLIPDVNLRRPERANPRRLCELIAFHNATQIGGSPTLLGNLADHCLDQNRSLPGLKQVHAGGGPVLPQLLDKLRRCAPNAEISAVYGSTEAEPIACLGLGDIDPADRQATLSGRGLLVGTPVDSLQLRILSDRWGKPIGPFTAADFAADCHPPGVSGEIVVSGNHVLSGYLDPADDKETKFEVDSRRWHRTGDAGYLDHRGRLWLLGRCSGAVPFDGQTIYPFAIEQVARQHPQVRNAALVVVNGQRTLAVEPHHRRVDPAQFAGLVDRLPLAGVQQIRVVRKIPVDRRHNAKIDYIALRSLLEGQR